MKLTKEEIELLGYIKQKISWDKEIMKNNGRDQIAIGLRRAIMLIDEFIEQNKE